MRRRQSPVSLADCEHDRRRHRHRHRLGRHQVALGLRQPSSSLLAPIITKVETAINTELSKLAAADTPLDRAIVIAADKLAHELGVDEAFLDELVAGL